MNIEHLTRRSSKGVKGISFPAIIHNMNYHLVDLGVFEDGVVECWGGVDLDLFRKKIANGWVKTSLPDGGTISAHHLAHMTVSDATWFMTPEDLIARVESTVTALNPTRRDLVEMEGSETDTSGKIAKTKVYRGSASVWRNRDGTPVGAADKWAFWRGKDCVHVVKVALFEDDTVHITGAGERMEMTLGDLRTNACLQAVQDDDTIDIAGLCRFTAGQIEFTLSSNDLLAELEIDRDKMGGKQTPMQLTALAFRTYSGDPTRANLEILRDAYESVPKHLRPYCGDMDYKDIPIRIALYGEKEIENWSHYAASKARGLKLPSITVPKPKD